VPATVPVMATMSGRLLVDILLRGGRLVLTLTDAHADGSEKEEVATTELLNHVQTWEGRCDVDRVGNDLNDKGAVETCIQEILGAIVDCTGLSWIHLC
jgi:hypothetical protein